ncbi:hypothetical protein OEZ86_004563 [Tetradesmus obliquus]|nr:hypothetical protein OEZ86_004563 [Tetradesmus obliquus]
MACRTRTIAVPRAFLASCFPDLQQQPGQQQQVQLRVTVDAQPGADSTPAGEHEAQTATVACHHAETQFVLFGADPVLRAYANHTVTGMSGVRGSTQLTLHLQSPAAAAAAQQAAEAAAAAAETDPARWQELQAPGAITWHEHNSSNRCFRIVMPRTLAASVFVGPWQQPGFKVQLSVHKDGACIAGGPGVRTLRSLGQVNNKPCVLISTAAMQHLSGCRLTKIRAAPPNYLQAHFTAHSRSDTADVNMPVTAGALITSVCINGSVGLACFSLFAVLRQWKFTAKLYKPKRYVGADNAGGRAPAPLAAELPAGLLSWIKPVWCYPEPEVIDLCGLDVAVFFRLMQLGVKLFSFITIWCLLVVMPVNITGGYLESKHRRDPNLGSTHGLNHANFGSSSSSSSTGSYQWFDALTSAALNATAAATGHPSAALSSGATSDLYSSSSSSSSSAGIPDLPRLHEGGINNVSDLIHTNLDLLTLGNVYPGSERMWVHLASVYVITLVALKLLWDLSRDVAFKRAVFLAVQGRTGPGCSVLVTDVPGLEWGTPLHRA